MSFDDDVDKVAAHLQQRVHDSVERTRDSPLEATDPDAITRAFEADPLTLNDSDLDKLVAELRRRRNAFLAADAAKSLKKKDKDPKPPAATAEQHARLDKPPAELTIDDLFDDN